MGRPVEFPTIVMDGVVPPCEETQGMIGSLYLRCGLASTMLIFHEKDSKVYPMCEACGTHNRDNRGGIQVAALK